MAGVIAYQTNGSAKKSKEGGDKSLKSAKDLMIGSYNFWSNNDAIAAEIPGCDPTAPGASGVACAHTIDSRLPAGLNSALLEQALVQTTHTSLDSFMQQELESGPRFALLAGGTALKDAGQQKQFLALVSDMEAAVEKNLENASTPTTIEPKSHSGLKKNSRSTRSKKKPTELPPGWYEGKVK